MDARVVNQRKQMIFTIKADEGDLDLGDARYVAEQLLRMRGEHEWHYSGFERTNYDQAEIIFDSDEF